MTRLNWERANRDDKVRIRPVSATGIDRLVKFREQRRNRGRRRSFSARYPGWCANCKKPFGVGTLITRSAKGRIVHGSSCPGSSAG